MYHFKGRIAIAVFLFTAAAWSSETVDIKEERGAYQLNFDATYQTYIDNDIELAVTLPKGYTISAVMPGSPDYLSAAVVQNRLYLSKITPDNEIMTNLVCHVITNEGMEKELLFKLKSGKNTPKVLAIHFEEPNYSELNATVEAVKTRYTEQMNSLLSEQEKSVSKDVKQFAMKNARQWFIRSNHGGIKASNKGATARLMGLINFEGTTYVYIEGISKKDNCEIVVLEKVQADKQMYDAVYLGESPTEDQNLSMLVYEIPEVAFKKKKQKYKNRRFKLHLRIWSEKEIVKFKAQ